ncbi:MAG: hypothetical protein PHP76_05690 [Bacteroidales bacterium]|nr:hypothetical protein [Bacteroidales bacterium]
MGFSVDIDGVPYYILPLYVKDNTLYNTVIKEDHILLIKITLD